MSEKPWQSGEDSGEQNQKKTASIFRKGSQEDPGNHQPISLFSVSRMIFMEAMLRYMEERKVT